MLTVNVLYANDELKTHAFTTKAKIMLTADKERLATALHLKAVVVEDLWLQCSL